MQVNADSDLVAAAVPHIPVPPQLDLGVSETQLSQSSQLLLSILQCLELGQTAHPCRLLAERLVQRGRPEASLLRHAAVRTRGKRMLAESSESSRQVKRLSIIYDVPSIQRQERYDKNKGLCIGKHFYF